MKWLEGVQTALEKLWFNLQVWFGNRCECGGRMEQVEGWDKGQCTGCGKTVKW